MRIKALLYAFGEGEERPIHIPDKEWEAVKSLTTRLTRAFYYGQNSFQPVPNRYSVSCGDVIDLGGEFYLVQAMGWKPLTAAQVEEWAQVPQRDRRFHEWVWDSES